MFVTQSNRCRKHRNIASQHQDRGDVCQEPEGTTDGRHQHKESAQNRKDGSL